MLRPAVALVRRRAVRQELDRAPVGVRDPDGSLPLLVRRPSPSRWAVASSGRAGGVELEADVVEPRLAARDQLERVRLVVTGEEGTAVDALALDEPELDAPPGRCLVEVGDPQPDVVDAAEADQTRPSATRRSASSSGMASATWRVWAETWSCSPRPGEVDVPLDDRRS